MIEEYGTIIELKEQQIAVVQCVKHSACQHCPASGSCQLGDTDSKPVLVEAFNQAGGHVHDQVKVVTSTKNFLLSSFMLYIVPIIGLLIGGLIGQSIGKSSEMGIDPSLLSALFGVVFLLGTFLIINFVTRNLKREIFMPKIVSIYSQAETQTKST
jgi:sigma-E factor negative regulatory protein RseC